MEISIINALHAMVDIISVVINVMIVIIIAKHAMEVSIITAIRVMMENISVVIDVTVVIVIAIHALEVLALSVNLVLEIGN